MISRGWARTGVLSGIIIPPFGIFALQAGGVHVAPEAVWTLAISTFGACMVWLCRTTLSNQKMLTEVLLLIKGEPDAPGILGRLTSAETRLAEIPGEIRTSHHEAREAMTEPFAEFQGNIMRRIEGLENRERQRLEAGI